MGPQTGKITQVHPLALPVAAGDGRQFKGTLAPCPHPGLGGSDRVHSIDCEAPAKQGNSGGSTRKRDASRASGQCSGVTEKCPRNQVGHNRM